MDVQSLRRDGRHLFPGDSELAGLMRALDWSKTDLGPCETWPSTWRMAVSLCLTSRIPIVLYLGSNLTVLYNDAYISFLGDTKHPRSLGQPGRECWREIWDTIGPMLASVYATGQATWSEDVSMSFARRLPLEEVYVRFTFGPILAADGRTVDGIFCPCTETTEQVVGARRLETLRKLGLKRAETRTVKAACTDAASVIAENSSDIPYAAVYVTDTTGTSAVLHSWAGFSERHPFPRSVSLAEDVSEPWALRSVLQTQCATEIADHLDGSHLNLPGGPWQEPSRLAIVLPVFAATYERLSGMVILGASPRRVLDDAYRTFFDLIAGHIGSAIADAQAYEAERLRAEALAELDRAKTAFFSNVSHEFRTPLTLILGPLEDALNEPDLSEPSRSRLGLIHRNAARLLKLVNTLLDFSRIEAGRVEAVYEATDLGATTADLASVFRSAIERAGLRFTVNCSALAEPAYVDRDMWEKIVLNLLSNAFKFTFEGEISVVLRENAGKIELVVRDTGTGIPAAELGRVFNRFHRIAGAQGRTHEGTGIGLALAQELVKLHGGTISVESTEGRGSAFTVVIPSGSAHLPPDRIGTTRMLAQTTVRSITYVQEALEWLPQEEVKDSANGFHRDEQVMEPFLNGRSSQVPSFNRPKILIADDNADMRTYLSQLLNDRYDVRTVPNGEAALACVRDCPPDLLLTDVMMPKMDGFGLVARVRADDTMRTIPVIMLSARAGEESRVEGLDAGADDYLVKPFSARELIARVKGCLQLAALRAKTTSEIQRLNNELKKRVETGERLVSELNRSRAELHDKVKDLELFHDIAVSRELKLARLETENQRLKK